ncbi:phospholipase D family protein [Alkanindiges sp. WGS2144]|uniref:phospholipase D family protein n=1 Tax=Alkanindiges sp. WGS2144 TaxID=3366808 RepID=UPI003753233D
MRFFRHLLNKLNWTTKTMFVFLLGLWCFAYVASAVYQTYKPIPQGLNVASPMRPAEQVQFLADYTYINQQGQRIKEQAIFDQALAMIQQARRMIVIDMFLFNDYVGESKVQQRLLTAELSQALMNKRTLEPDVQITVITDPINTVYGGQYANNLLELRRSGIEVIETNLKPLRASNPLWSGFWYMCCQWFDNNPQAGWLPNPLGKDKITLRSYFSLFNFKANHRKTLVTDAPDGWQALVTSGNPHDASSWHGNVALKFSGQAALDVLETERAVSKLSGVDLPVIITAVPKALQASEPQLQVLTEGKIRDALLNSLQTAQPGDQIDIAVFYLSQRSVIKAIKQAQQNKVAIRVLLDPNEDAFGRKKNGIPNRQVAMELYQVGVPLRWCDTHGEQCHSKILLKTSAKTGQSELILGSANFTRRNLNNLNLETDVRFVANADNTTIQQVRAYFERIWSNQNGQGFSVAYDQYKDESGLKYWWYRFSEWSGLSTF